MRNSELLLNELLTKQLLNVPNDKKLQFNDLRRMCKYINKSIFDENICSIWNGYLTNMNNISKGVYINFYYKGKKAALHRLIYSNFIDTLAEDEYIKFTCDNKGKCCNIHHMKKFKYLNKTNKTKKIQNFKKKAGRTNIISPSLTLSLSFD